MIYSLLSNPFMNYRVNRKKFARFCKEHLAVLKAKDPVKYGEIISLLEPLVVSYEKLVGDDVSDSGLREGSTIAINNLIEAIEDKVDDIYEEVVYKFKRKQPAVYEAFFPSGKRVFGELTQTNLVPLVSGLLNACEQWIDDLNEADVMALQALLNDFKEEQGKHTEKKDHVKENSHTEQHLRDSLAGAMRQSLLRLLLIHENDPDAVLMFYLPEFLHYRRRPADRKAPEENTPE